MASKHICPKCGGTSFYTVAHIMQEWLVDENGEFAAVSDKCLEVIHGPDDGNIWTCAKCGDEAIIAKEG